jgi:DNA polymerase V
MKNKAILADMQQAKSVIAHGVTLNGKRYPLYLSKVQAGFPSPADDYIDKKLSLDEYCINDSAATFFVYASGDSMIGAGIFPNDLLIVDRSIEAVHGKIVIAVLDGELTVKRLHIGCGKVTLMPENKAYKPIVVPELSELNIWGVVTNVIHKV